MENSKQFKINLFIFYLLLLSIVIIENDQKLKLNVKFGIHDNALYIITCYVIHEKHLENHSV